MDQLICGTCGKPFDEARSDDATRAEASKLFGLPPEAVDLEDKVCCNDCFVEILEMMKTVGWPVRQ